MSVFRLLDAVVGERDVQIPTPAANATPPGGGPTTQPVLLALINTVSSDPGGGQDITQGYVPGSMVFNNTANQLRFWTCRSNTAGAAAWVFDGADYANGGTNPATDVTQFGGASIATMAAEGNINRQISSAGVTPGATGSDIILAIYSLPANAFDASGRGLGILAQGSTGADSTTKTIKLIVGAAGTVGGVVGGGTTVASLTCSGTGAGGGWQLEANIFKYGAVGSNTQLAFHTTAQSGNSISPLVAPSALTLTESGAIAIMVTANVTISTVVTFQFLEINAMN